MSSKVLELFGESTRKVDDTTDWAAVLKLSHCPFLLRKCVKVRKSQPDISIGTCSLRYGRDERDIVICPHRLLQHSQIFVDCLHLLTRHEPGNELHVLGEQSIPGGSVDYVLVSAAQRKVRDFVGIELQTMDTTGTVWPERQRFLRDNGLRANKKDVESKKSFGMNWKMTAKTILVQLHHKIHTFEHINKHLVLVLQDHLLAYMTREFAFEHLAEPATIADPMHFHSYRLEEVSGDFSIKLDRRLSTDSDGIATCLGLQASPHVELEKIVSKLEEQLCEETLLSIHTS